MSKQVRTLLEKFSRGIVFRKRYSSEFKHASIFVTPQAGLKYLFKDVMTIDKSLLTFAHTFIQKGSVVWDVGANIGLFTIAAAIRCEGTGKVVAIEPDILLVSLLDRSSKLQASDAAQIDIIPCAAAESMSIRAFHIANRARATSHLEGYGTTQTGGIRGTVQVITITLDWLAEFLPVPDVLKIDVEGAEIEVIRGGYTMISSKRPKILCEVGNENAKEFSSILKPLGYQFFDADLDPGCTTEVAFPTFNTIAIAT